MVSLTDVQASNARIASTLPAGVVAVFVGATNGVGEATLRQFAKHALKPRVYFVGRSQEAGERIAQECKAVNPDGKFTFIQADVSLLHNVDDVCRNIKSKESALNLLFQSQGTADFFAETSEGLLTLTALAYYSRLRFASNLLPLLQRATGLRRVVTVLAGTKEGAVAKDDLQGRNLSVFGMRGHAASITTLALEALAKKAPSVAFVHDYPGTVQTGLGRDGKGVFMFILRTVVAVIGPLIAVPIVECGERHLFLATSARYPAQASHGKAAADGVPVSDGIAVARGTDGQDGSGVYSVEHYCESAGAKVEALLAGFREEGLVETLWGDTEAEFERITGVTAGQTS